jgi:hypothetical protein
LLPELPPLPGLIALAEPSDWRRESESQWKSSIS